MHTENQNEETLQSDSITIDILQEILKYLKYWPWFVISLIFTLSSVYLYKRYTSSIFETQLKIKILDETEGLELPTTGFVFNRSNINLDNEIEILTSYIILEQVVERLDLTIKYYEVGTIKTKRLDKLPFVLKPLRVNDSINNFSSYNIDVESDHFFVTSDLNNFSLVVPQHSSLQLKHELPFQISLNENIELKEILNKRYVVTFDKKENIIQELKKSIQVLTGGGSDILTIKLNGESKTLSQNILNTLASVFDEDGILDKQLVSQRTITFIDERFRFLSKELDSIEIDYQGFKERNDLIDMKIDVELGLNERSKSESELFILKNQISLAKLLQKSLKANDNGGLLPINIGLENNGINNLIFEYNNLVSKRNKLSTYSGENNPALQFLDKEINNFENNVFSSLLSYINQLNVSEDAIRRKALGYSGKILQIPEKERLLKTIVRQQKIKESLYLLLLQKREEAAINLAITEPSIKIVEYALSGQKPISPNGMFLYLIGIVLGLFFPFGILYLSFLLDNKVHTRDDIEKVTTNIPILAEIPEIKKKGSLLFTNPNATSILAESFRILSANVDYLLPKNSKVGAKTIFCTSTIKGEGKTFVSLNLSLALASLNKKVLLIGADMRNPQIHTYFGTSKNQLGLSSYLNDASVNWKELLMTGFDKHPKHYTMLSGAIPPNPAHLLTNGRFEQLLAEVRAEFDYVIVDTAPTILVTDTLLISRFADVTLFLTKANFTAKKLLKFSKELSESGKIKNMAYVMNSVGAGNSYSYGYGYGYNYGYSYGYHEEN